MRLLDKPIRAPIEQAVSEYVGRPWSVGRARDLSEFACHPCGILSDGTFGVFAKFSDAPEARSQFETELAGLRYLSAAAGVRIPTPIGIVAAQGGTLLLVEALEVIERRPPQWREIGQVLARIHRVKSDTYGFTTDGFYGPLYQDNTPALDWMTFYGERRLQPALRTAIDSGNLPSSMASRVEKVMARLPELGGPESAPSLLHGDAQQNNFMSTARGTFVIDPAVYCGNPEIDLALVGCFQPAPDDVFDAYREEMPIDPGFADRQSLWRLSTYLAAVAIEGQIHLDRLAGALQRYE